MLAIIAMAACTSVRGSSPRGAPAAAEGNAADDAGIAKARTDSARHPWTTADAHFMTAMIGHHSQAIAMARLAPTHGASASVRTLAERIINAQQDEIATMRQWLRDRRQPVPEAHADMPMTHGTGHGMPMPGMVSPAQMARLEAARGDAFDRLLLVSMIQHHRGAVSMVQALFATDGAAQDQSVFKLASDVNVDQITEIARMEKMLVALVSGGDAP